MTSSESSFPAAEDRVHTLGAETNQLHITHTSQLVCQCCQATVQGVTRLQRLFWSCGQETDVLRRRMAQTRFFLNRIICLLFQFILCAADQAVLCYCGVSFMVS